MADNVRVPHINENLSTEKGRANDNWHRFFDEVATAGNTGIAAKKAAEAIAGQVYGDTFSIAYPDNGTENVLINAPFGFTINSITSKCSSGTCTATFKIGGTALGGGANSVSTTEQTKTHSSANVVDVGDDLTCTISSNSSCEKAVFTIAYMRT